MAIEHITLKTFKEKIYDFEDSKDWKLKGENPCIIDFYTDWCGPCKMMEPILNELATELSGKIVFAKLNVDKNPVTPSKYGISSIPTFLIVKNGQVMNSIIGVVTQEIFEEKINEYL